jgi:hypothetical protein
MLCSRRHALLASAAALAMPLGLTTRRASAQGSTQGSTQGGAQGSARKPGSPDAYLYIGWPQNGEVVTSPFKIWFGLRNFGVAPAGVEKARTGHHHLIIDAPLPPLDQEIPNDRNHLHFGLGQTEARIELPPGTHTLQLLLADENHVPHDPPIVSRVITIQVRPGRPAPPNVATR